MLVLEFIVFSAISPYFLSVDTVGRDLQLHRAGDRRVATGAADHCRRDRHLGGRHHCARFRGHGAWRRRRAWAPRHLLAWASAHGLLAGCINGALVTFGRVPSIVATIGTMTLFRAARRMRVPGDRVLKDYPKASRPLGGDILPGRSPSSWRCSRSSQLSFGVFLHRTRWGRTIFAIGANPVAQPVRGGRR